MSIHLPSEYTSASAWERVIGMISGSAMRVHSVLLIPSGNLFPDAHGEAGLEVRARRGGESSSIGFLTMGRRKFKAFVPAEFNMHEYRAPLNSGTVLTLMKDNLRTRGFSLPDCVVQVELEK